MNSIQHEDLDVAIAHDDDWTSLFRSPSQIPQYSSQWEYLLARVVDHPGMVSRNMLIICKLFKRDQSMSLTHIQAMTIHGVVLDQHGLHSTNAFWPKRHTPLSPLGSIIPRSRNMSTP